MIRMKISGHKTDSMERRYNIVDADDLSIEKEFMKRRMKATKKCSGCRINRDTRGYTFAYKINNLWHSDTR